LTEKGPGKQYERCDGDHYNYHLLGSFGKATDLLISERETGEGKKRKRKRNIQRRRQTITSLLN